MKLAFQILPVFTLLLAGPPVYSQERPNRNRGGGNRTADTVKAGILHQALT